MMMTTGVAATKTTVNTVLKSIRYAQPCAQPGCKAVPYGSVHDVIHLTLGCPKAKLPRVCESVRASFPELFEDVVKVRFAGRGQRPTPCMPRDKLQTLAQFMIDKKRVSAKSVKTTTTRGVVYIATAPVLLACKIGMWRGKLSDLRNRYVTAYGGGLNLDVYHFEDCLAAEKRVHARFASRRIVGELYDLACVDEYRDWLEAVTMRHASA